MASRVTSRHRRSSSRTTHNVIEFDPLRRRCRTLIRKRSYRSAAIALRELANRDQNAAVWVRLGAALTQCGRSAGAVDAFKQGWWLFRQRGEDRKAAVVTRLIGGLESCSQLAA